MIRRRAPQTLASDWIVHRCSLLVFEGSSVFRGTVIDRSIGIRVVRLSRVVTEIRGSPLGTAQGDALGPTLGDALGPTLGRALWPSASGHTGASH
jgi:hypothetical protein